MSLYSVHYQCSTTKFKFNIKTNYHRRNLEQLIFRNTGRCMFMTDTKFRFLNHVFRFFPFEDVLLNVSINVKNNFCSFYLNLFNFVPNESP